MTWKTQTTYSSLVLGASEWVQRNGSPAVLPLFCHQCCIRYEDSKVPPGASKRRWSPQTTCGTPERLRNWTWTSEAGFSSTYKTLRSWPCAWYKIYRSDAREQCIMRQAHCWTNNKNLVRDSAQLLRLNQIFRRLQCCKEHHFSDFWHKAEPLLPKKFPLKKFRENSASLKRLQSWIP